MHHVHLAHGPKSKPVTQLIGKRGDQAPLPGIGTEFRAGGYAHIWHQGKGTAAFIIAPQVLLEPQGDIAKTGLPQRAARRGGTDFLIGIKNQLEVHAVTETGFEIDLPPGGGLRPAAA